jgi:uncharacterized membrane protein YdcZ (DUF606 family)
MVVSREPHNTAAAMTDKPRHRRPAPKGQLPNWALVAGIVGAMVVISLARGFG